jgi:uroporphyrinogen decarboxylase
MFRKENARLRDGIHAVVPDTMMDPAARKLRDVYAIKPGAPVFQKEFGFYCQEAWRQQGLMPGCDYAAEFGYDAPGKHALWGAGWCEAAFTPPFEEKVLEDRGEHEVVQDHAGRKLLCFKNRRSGFMPEYMDHPVKNQATWERLCAWRLDPGSPERWHNFEADMTKARHAAGQGLIITQCVIGGYMYLRSLIGPEKLLYMFYDNPALVHTCMGSWLRLADAVTTRHQQHVTIDELFLGEDICYNSGSLISPDMMREFLFPYYRQLITNIKQRQLDPNRHLYFQIDTDGQAGPVIPLYQELGMDVMSPFEVASGCDVVAIGKQFPDLVISGGIDKRVLAEGKRAIDAHVDYIMPVMQRRGGYIPTCDHGVPAEVSLENYRYFRKRMLEYA